MHKEVGITTRQDSESTSLSLRSRNEPSVHDLTMEIENSTAKSPLIRYKLKAYCRDAFSEFFGTMILILFGDGVVAQVLLSHGQKGDHQSISWGWGYACITNFLQYCPCLTMSPQSRCHARCIRQRSLRGPYQPSRHVRQLRLS
jgi:hypothetical protein